MTPLAARLVAEIKANGAMSLADYMRRALYDPEHGYYICREIFGREGDFITAPEVSQLFGETIAAWFMDLWQRVGTPHPFALVELGAGRGTLMADMLRAARIMPEFLKAAQIHFVEISPHLRAQQKERVPNAQWHDTIDTLPQVARFIIANEFFDALPIQQYRSDGRNWHEVVVDVQNDVLMFGERASDVSFPPASMDMMHEQCAEGETIMAQLATALANNGGALLTIDYGYKEGAGETLQAVKDHKPVSPLDFIGEADLTAHVNFSSLEKAARLSGAQTAFTTQGAFLRMLGIEYRAQKLANVYENEAEKIIGECRRLIHSDEMGTLFKILAVTHKDYPSLAGFSK